MIIRVVVGYNGGVVKRLGVVLFGWWIYGFWE